MTKPAETPLSAFSEWRSLVSESLTLINQLDRSLTAANQITQESQQTVKHLQQELQLLRTDLTDINQRLKTFEEQQLTTSVASKTRKKVIATLCRVGPVVMGALVALISFIKHNGQQ